VVERAVVNGGDDGGAGQGRAEILQQGAPDDQEDRQANRQRREGLWKAAVVANCHRDRSMKVCEFIFSVFLGRSRRPRQTQAERGRTGSGTRSWPGARPAALSRQPDPDNHHGRAVTPVPHPGRRPIRLPASRGPPRLPAGVAQDPDHEGKDGRAGSATCLSDLSMAGFLFIRNAPWCFFTGIVPRHMAAGCRGLRGQALPARRASGYRQRYERARLRRRYGPGR
jgi:hypothetical protein